MKTDCKWHNLIEALEGNCIPDGPGVYYVKREWPVNRICGPDPSGLLYIGSTDALKRRLGLFRGSALDGSEGHVAGQKYNKWGYDPFLAPLSELKVRWEETDNPGSDEDVAKQKYTRTFHELPPLNGQQ